MKKILILLIVACAFQALDAQTTGRTRINGEILPYMIDECGDTLIMAQLDDVSISMPRKFSSREEYKKYLMYKRYAVKVYPYAVEAIKVFRQVEYATTDMKKGKRKKYVKKLQKQLDDDFKKPLKKLTKTQGKILIKMIEKELDTPMYTLIKNLRGGLSASYWGTMAGLFGHKLKEGYIEGADPIMDAVLNDLNISHEGF